MILRQTFSQPIGGFWDGGPKSVFDWTIDGTPHVGSWYMDLPRRYHKTRMVRVGSWEANCFFTVPVGKTDKHTLSNARRRLAHRARKAGNSCTFEYVR